MLSWAFEGERNKVVSVLVQGVNRVKKQSFICAEFTELTERVD